jgi:23S rRNA pseudouridine1911/1915/1917 synthase
LIVVAKTDRAHLNLAEQFESRSVMKDYTAMVYGAVKEDSGKIEAPIGRDPRNRVKMAVTRDGRHATTLYRVVERFDEFTLLDVEIKTGRTHQIRVHLAHIKHPVVADSTYGAGRANSIKSAKLRAEAGPRRKSALFYMRRDSASRIRRRERGWNSTPRFPLNCAPSWIRSQQQYRARKRAADL